MEVEAKERPGRQATVLFPTMGTRVGGSIVSTMLLARAVESIPGWKVRIALPRRGPNADLFQMAGLEPEFYGLSQKRVEGLRGASGLRGKLWAVPGIWSVYRQAVRFLKKDRPDIVHANDDATMLIWGLAASRFGIPLVWHVRQSRGSFLSDNLRARLANQVVFNSCASAARLPQLEGSRRQYIIHNVVDTDRYFPAESRREQKERFGILPERTLIGFVGNLMSRKRPEWLVQAGVDLLKEGHDVELFIVGRDYSEGAYERKLRELTTAANAVNRIHLLGYRSDVPEIMRALDIFALPSIAEPFGLVVIEAMASKAAVVATRDGGVPEIVEDGRTGLLSSPTDYESFLSALRMMVVDEKKREQFAEAAHRSVLSRFAAERIGEEISGVYEQALRG